MMVLLASASCSREEEIRAEMPFSLCLPANEVYLPNLSPRRMIGDPGTVERFALPAHAYIIILRDLGTGWEVYRCMEETLTEEDWQLDVYGGIYETEGNAIYRCMKRMEILLNDKGVNQRVYAVASSVPLTFSKTFSTSAIQTIDDVLELKIDMSSQETREAVANIYSTPYNYNRPGTSTYYCSFTSPKVSSHASLDLLLYHIAAKVDIKWNVEEDKRINKEHPEEAVRLTYMQARNLFAGNAYCFKPMRNVSPAVSSSEASIVAANDDEGKWWEGRSYFYTIPYTVEGTPDYFPLQMTLRTNGSTTGTGYQPTLNLEIDTSSVFVPWLRANFNLSAPLEDKTETIEVMNNE